MPWGSGVRRTEAGAGRASRPLAWLVVLLLAGSGSAVLAGCGSSGSRQTASGRAALLSTLENWSALQTPVDQALGILTQQCMAQHGYRYYPVPPKRPARWFRPFRSARQARQLWKETSTTLPRESRHERLRKGSSNGTRSCRVSGRRLQRSGSTLDPPSRFGQTTV